MSEAFEAHCARLVRIKKYVQISKICQSTWIDEFRCFAEAGKRGGRRSCEDGKIDIDI